MTAKKKPPPKRGGGKKKNLGKGRPKKAELTPMEQLFVVHYLKKQVGTKAAILAGYSERTAAAMANKLLKRPMVKAAIEKEMAERCDRVRVDADWLLQRLADEATADVAELFYEEGGLKPVHEWPEIWRTGLVAGIDVYREMSDGKQVGETVKVKLADRMKRLEAIGKHVKVNAFQENHKHDVSEGFADALAKARKRASQ